ncbi:tetratricopeptide repeat protein [Agromyces aurantiacus]|uniref:Tetratricopeptide repeat protein n=1 Tax=Agromyces aurantiacus TaxID=165814 RepID=A0ABV9R8V9_9MICO|nr:tetratricopeptide repeat protein [Agromyces aurantiacus]MBM7504962.1 tetratricopeptide (TPR) repeat protein [Agromyces aurantiacus]
MDEWQRRVDAVWEAASELGERAVIERIDALAAELPAGDPRGPFEAAGARDAAGLEQAAEPLYRRALELGLAGRPRVEAHIQLASTLRNLGRPAESLAVLDAVRDEAGDLADAVAAFRALALASSGAADAAASVALIALAPHLAQYRRAVDAYARELGDGAAGVGTGG